MVNAVVEIIREGTNWTEVLVASVAAVGSVVAAFITSWNRRDLIKRVKPQVEHLTELAEDLQPKVDEVVHAVNNTPGSATISEKVDDLHSVMTENEAAKHADT